jgi:NAD(P)-dependent dehydrogenase (short-subunit alcohol dehydrogenase family)
MFERNTVLITGAAKRLGRSLALDFATRGWSVGVHCHNSEAEAAEVVGEITRGGGRAVVLTADLSATVAAAQLIERTARALGPVTCLVNNASLFVYDDIASVTPTQWNQHLAINVTAPLFLTQTFAAALPIGRTGNVINIMETNATLHFLPGLQVITLVNDSNTGASIGTAHSGQWRRTWAYAPERASNGC